VKKEKCKTFQPLTHKKTQTMLEKEEVKSTLGSVHGTGVETRNATEILVRKSEPTEWKYLSS
jgi:hypothetical protein